MPAASELQTLIGLSKQSWLMREEQQRFRDVIKKWKNENKDAGREKEILIESLIRCHIWEQRLIDKRFFFNGERTDYRVEDGRKMTDLSAEDQERKDREWMKYMPLIQGWKLKYLQLALANSIDVQIVNDFQGLFGAIDPEDRRAMERFRNNGEAKAKAE